MIRFAFLIAALALIAPAHAQSPLSEPSPTASVIPDDPEAQAEEVDVPDAAPEVYRIRPGDTLTISVLEDPNLTRTVLVRPDGRVSLPIAGSVLVQGVTPEDLEKILAERFSRGFQITPTVTVSIRGLAPGGFAGPGGVVQEQTRFYVLGAAARRGPFVTPEEMTVLEALAVAGGPTPFAATSRIQIRRVDENGVEQILLFDYERLEDGEPVEGNVLIEDGDIIYVPERGLFE